jgi:quinol-cytochrome oxidoreductase complex cytochrome b subunit
MERAHSPRERQPGVVGAVVDYLDSRIGLAGFFAFLRKKEVPLHKHAVWYYGGGITLFFFTVQLLTGFLLIVYYQPTAAHSSVQAIVSEVEFGWLIRSVHSWSANLMVAAAFVHMFSVFFLRAYHRLRDLTWYSGFGLLLLAFGLGFTGYALPFDEVAFFATKIGFDVAASMPVAGETIATLLRGGEEVNATTMQRMFALHAAVLPVLFMPLLMLHLWLVQQHGNHVPDEIDPKEVKTVAFFPSFFFNDLIVWLICLNLLTVLAAIYPWELGPAADPLKPAPLGIHPEWYYMAQFQFLKLMPAEIAGIPGELLGMGLFSGAAGLWALVPLFDRGAKRPRRILYLGYFALVSLIVLTIWGYVG